MSETDSLDELYEKLELECITQPASQILPYDMLEGLVAYQKYGRLGWPAKITNCISCGFYSKRGGTENVFVKPGTNHSMYSLLKHAHRRYGPAYINHSHNIEIWAVDGIIHREDGPAIVQNKSMVWMRNGLFHREDGPALDTNFCSKQYWINGQRLSPKNYKKEIARRKRRGLIK